MHPTDIIASSLMALSGALLIITVTFISILYHYRERKLIKASGKESMAIIMGGIVLAYCTVFMFIMTPSQLACYCSHFGFNVAVTLIYAPLLVKTNRVYRIFAGSEKFSKEFWCISLKSQLGITAFVCAVQVMSLI